MQCMPARATSKCIACHASSTKRTYHSVERHLPVLPAAFYHQRRPCSSLAGSRCCQAAFPDELPQAACIRGIHRWLKQGLCKYKVVAVLYICSPVQKQLGFVMGFYLGPKETRRESPRASLQGHPLGRPFIYSCTKLAIMSCAAATAHT